jgi:predicted SAM-dependent methyltransferase
MNLSENKIDEILELINLVLIDDKQLFDSIVNSEYKSFYSKDELVKTINEISSEKMKKVFEKKLRDYESDRKKFLMEKYGQYLLNDRIVRSTINSNSIKNKYSFTRK